MLNNLLRTEEFLKESSFSSSSKSSWDIPFSGSSPLSSVASSSQPKKDSGGLSLRSSAATSRSSVASKNSPSTTSQVGKKGGGEDKRPSRKGKQLSPHAKEFVPISPADDPIKLMVVDAVMFGPPSPSDRFPEEPAFAAETGGFSTNHVNEEPSSRMAPDLIHPNLADAPKSPNVLTETTDPEVSRFYAISTPFLPPAAHTLPIPTGEMFARSLSTCAVAGSDSSRMSDSEDDRHNSFKFSYEASEGAMVPSSSPGTADLPILIEDSDSSSIIRQSINKMIDEQEVFGGSSSDYDTSSSSSGLLVPIQRRLPSLEYPIFTPQPSPSHSHTGLGNGIISGNAYGKEDRFQILRRLIQDAHESKRTSDGTSTRTRQDTPFPDDGLKFLHDSTKRHR
jgi:hypothetical protein